MGFETDQREAAKLERYVPRAEGEEGLSWWQAVAKNGMTRAIDAHFGPTTIDKTQAAGTFAGQNGKTYDRQAVPSAAALPFGLSGSTLTMVLVGLAGAAAVFFALKK